MKLTWSRLSSNPIFVRLAGRNRWIPPAFVFVLLPIVQGMLTTFWSIPHLRSSFPGHSIVWTMLAGWSIALITPAIVAVTAMVSVVKDAASKDYQLITLTNISAGRQVNGYIAGVLYQLRFFLLVLAIIAPWLASGMVMVYPDRQAIYYLRGVPSMGPPRSPHIDLGMLPVDIAIGSVFLHLMVWGLILLAVNTGVVFGLKWRHNLSIALPVTVCMLLLDGAVIYGWTVENWGRDGPGIVGIQPLQAVICAGIIMFSLWIYQLAQRWA